jgi:tetratricopeptide (TPR) repeat protein/tRNA A-37 threonylcarbamoyl transferase component Bud32
VRRLGQGGQGTVFEAVRDDGAFEQRVAIKVVKWELDTAIARERFLHERQILAGIEHPYVARLLDGGQTESGSPYLVMEYVEGLPLARAAADWSLNRKLHMFLKVCDAVDYAHRNLVVHRDLKPANILVTKAGDPKLLDFGIAKLMDPEATSTATGVFALTPEYASPEQVCGGPITTASDVYSLGVILYQLLTGRKPYLLDTSATPGELFRIIAEQAPAPPGLGDELDHILMMALRKEPSRRYGSARQLADDIQRYLEKRPVLARPDTVGYRARKYVQRHWVGLMAASIALAGVCVGAGVAVYQARIAEQRFNDVRSLANTFLFDFEKEIRDVPGTVKAREMVVSTALNYLNRLSASSSRDPGLQWELAIAYDKVAEVQGSTVDASMRRPQDAIQSEEKAIALGRRLDDSHSLESGSRDQFVNMLLHAAIMDRDMKRYGAAIAYAKEAVARSEGSSPDRRFAAMGDLGMIMGAAGDLSGSTAAAERLVPIARANLERQPNVLHRRQLGDALLALGEGYADSGHLQEALQATNEALRIFRSVLLEIPGTAAVIRENFYTLNNLGRIEGAFDHPNLGKPLDGAAWFEQSIGVMEPLLAKDPNDRAAKNDIGEMEQRLASTLMNAAPRRGLPHAERAAALLDAASPDKLDLRVQPRIIIALSYLTLGQLGEAERALNEADRILKSTVGSTEALRNMAWARLESAKGRRSNAEQRFQRAIASEEELFKTEPIPNNACLLAIILDYAAAALPDSAPAYRARIAAIWSDQNQRFPHSSFIERQLADAQTKLAHGMAVAQPTENPAP